jgi:hypothetical protein
MLAPWSVVNSTSVPAPEGGSRSSTAGVAVVARTWVLPVVGLQVMTAVSPATSRLTPSGPPVGQLSIVATVPVPDTLARTPPGLTSTFTVATSVRDPFVLPASGCH